MILLEVKRYIRQHQQVSLENILHHFDITPDTARGLLMPLIAQGHIVEIPAGSCSTGKCSTSCKTHSEHYQWIERKLRPVPIAIQISS